MSNFLNFFQRHPDSHWQSELYRNSLYVCMDNLNAALGTQKAENVGADFAMIWNNLANFDILYIK